MSFVLISGNINSGIQANNNDDIVILEGATVSNSDFNTVTFSTPFNTDPTNTNLSILGNVLSGFHALDGFGNSDLTNINIFVGETGTIISAIHAVRFGIVDDVSISNEGLIRAEREVIAIDEITDYLRVENTGTISSSRDSAFLVAASPGDLFIENSGVISGFGENFDETLEINSRLVLTNTGLISSSAGFAIGSAGFDDIIQNSGTIQGRVELGLGNNLINNSGTIFGGVITGGDNDRIFNSGEITSAIDTNAGNDLVVNRGVLSGSIFLGSNEDRVINTGEISGAILASSGNDDVLNFGTIMNLVVMDSGEDRVVNAGVVTSNVDLGTGADVYRALGDGLVVGSILGGDGDDVITGASQTDLVFGGADNDIIRGMGGDDELYGEGQNDRLFGGAGNDNVYGGDNNDVVSGDDGDDNLFGQDGADRLFGGRGEDTLYGGLLDDRLFGGAGNDTLEGSLGRDQFYGGADNDTFLFTSTFDSPDSQQRDIIFDFTAGEDVINVTQLAGPAFDFVGTAAFTGTGGEVRFATAGTGVNVFVDADGDGTADMRIFLADTASLTADDFIL